jgi:hypothetical protein
VVNRAENKVAIDRLEQIATETTTLDGKPWTDTRMQVKGRHTGQPSAPGDIQLQ